MLLTSTITDYWKKSLLKNGKNIEFDHVIIIENALVVAQDIEKQYLSSNNVDNLI